MLKKNMLNKEVKEYKAKDIMTKNVITLPPSESLLKAQSLMTKYRIKGIVVVEDEDSAVGIITIKDIIRFVISDPTDREMHEIPIDEAIIKRLITTEKNSTVVECAQVMARENVRSIVVVKEAIPQSPNPKLSGIITSSDLTNFFGEKCTSIATLRDYMSYPVITIAFSDKISNATELMLKNHISHLVVTGPGYLVGIISETDLLLLTLAFTSKSLRSVYENNLILFHSSKKRNLIEPAFATFSDVFHPYHNTIEQDSDLAEAAKIMTRERISAIPVVDSLEAAMEDRPVGIITKTDIVKALSQVYKKVRP